MPDFINGCFQFCGGVIIWLSIFKCRRDKKVRGVHWLQVVFFSTWGYWNLFYYPHLEQWLSFVAGIMVVSANTIWAAHLIYYVRLEKRGPQRPSCLGGYAGHG